MWLDYWDLIQYEMSAHYKTIETIGQSKKMFGKTEYSHKHVQNYNKPHQKALNPSTTFFSSMQMPHEM